MGQYHILVNFTKREFVHPHKLGNGLKLLEQVGWEYAFSNVTHILIAGCSGRGGGDFPIDGVHREVVGRWAGDQIALVGDYAEPTDFDMSQAEFELMMHQVHNSEKFNTGPMRDSRGRFASKKGIGYTDISSAVAKSFSEMFGVSLSGMGWKTLKALPAKVPAVEFDSRIHDSSLVAKMKYETDGKYVETEPVHTRFGTLTIVFVSNPTVRYIYKNVTGDVAYNFRNAVSKGRFYHEHIKGKYESETIR